LLPVFSCQRTARRQSRRPVKEWLVNNDEVFATAHHSLLVTPLKLVELIGIEPTTSGLQNRRSPN
jgi:hypothetical protein